ncbi:uncharacterized protein DUF5017 [Mucilaginibacter gracilis]|uniref:Uncharacterized protein DUF5017 n=1 Tax=Mucilaginibacter gracilis TaxID=423350 RepID=A0A495IUG1_9SPHI|nr:DUF5017 domain-containing protein [Mucilaginibacter gracilis]RKR80386.1 uncharacterized protein DUF5017 [Mucilaginibacter gracilis]
MLKRYLYTGTTMLLFCLACNKNMIVKPVGFDVNCTKLNGTATTTFSAKDTLQFNFSGNPDVITFYSGEQGKRYEFASRTSAFGASQLQFSTLRANGTQSNSLAVFVSSDFQGVVTRIVNGALVRDTASTNANIAAATWNDITSRASLSTGGTTALSSGVIDLSDFASQLKPVYIAFKYSADAGSIQNKWTITNLTLNNALADAGVYTNASLNGPTTAITNYGNTTFGPGWAVSYDLAKNSNKYAWVYTDKTSLVITGATTAALATAPAEAWAIMGPVDLNRVTPDVGVAIKAIASTQPNYQYIYPVAGNYHAVFVAGNYNATGSSTNKRDITVTIKP